jgi:hypothetical protein
MFFIDSVTVAIECSFSWASDTTVSFRVCVR